MKKVLFFFAIIFAFGCWEHVDSSFPYSNAYVPVKKVKLYKSLLTINDTVTFTGAYYQKKGTIYTKDEDCLYGNLHVKDTLITDDNPKDYVIRRRDGIDTKFYRWPLNEE